MTYPETTVHCYRMRSGKFMGRYSPGSLTLHADGKMTFKESSMFGESKAVIVAKCPPKHWRLANVPIQGLKQFGSIYIELGKDSAQKLKAAIMKGHAG